MKPSLRVEGLADLDRALQNMAKTTAKRTARKAMADSLSPVLRAAQALAPVGPTGNLRDSVTVSHKLTPSQAAGAPREGKHVLHMYVGASAPHAHLVEFGTGPRYLKKAPRTGKFVGSMPPNPWMRPAWDANSGEVLDRLAADLFAQIQGFLARAARREANAAKRAARKAKA